MLNLSCYSNRLSDTPHLESIDGLSHPRQMRTRLPRHISSLESPSRHRGDQAKIAPARPEISRGTQVAQAEAINLAVSILDYQLKSGAAQQKHLENLRSNLQHRWQVAKATNNSQLMAMLQEEFKQLATTV